ncbi:MAG: hypothetical protein AVDCRST_MAG96-3398 [uncultured Segetibacter sp.]|uniref:Uncharacterized protein n=1 Tax=uncultured Segetibacter sp. TaxID=481133 RepID=A0A6J4TRJ5_9BACT|nr:MAG: hypothetical protein AVDCRST_MAG96-3398 [uncultured Segetibacter sp.]
MYTSYAGAVIAIRLHEVEVDFYLLLKINLLPNRKCTADQS